MQIFRLSVSKSAWVSQVTAEAEKAGKIGYMSQVLVLVIHQFPTEVKCQRERTWNKIRTGKEHFSVLGSETGVLKEGECCGGRKHERKSTNTPTGSCELLCIVPQR